MYLLRQNGFSSGSSLMLDQVCSRQDTSVYIRLWTDDVQKPHDPFVRELRQNMSAIVEICWRGCLEEFGTRSSTGPNASKGEVQERQALPGVRSRWEQAEALRVLSASPFLGPE